MIVSRRTAGTARRWLWLALFGLLAIAAAMVGYLALAQRSGGSGTGEPIAVFLGDSYTQGTGATSPDQRWTSLVSAERGWSEVNLGRGGTGYLTAAGVEGCGREICPNYVGMVAEAVDVKPDVVVVAGGQNDFSAFRDDSTTVVAQVDATFEALREALPRARIVAVGPSSPGEAGESALALDAEVRRAAEAVDALYVSLLQPPVITESMVRPDGAHVGDAGHAAIAERVLDALAAS